MASMERGSVDFHWILFFPAVRQERWLLRRIGTCIRTRVVLHLLSRLFLFFCTIFITLCTATNFGYVFFPNSFSFNSTRSRTLLQTIFVLYFHRETPNAHLASNGSTNSVGSFSLSNTRTHARRCCTSALFSGSGEKLSPRGFFWIIAHTRCDTSSRRQ